MPNFPAFALAPRLPHPQNSLRFNPLCPLRRTAAPSLSISPTARLSDSRHAYRLSSLLATKARPSSRAPAVAPTPSAPSAPSNPQLPPPRPPAPPRYLVRPAQSTELYTVADIRCAAFYGNSAAMTYYPVRRREIYMAMRDRLASGNRCLVVLDTTPPQDWLPFTNDEGHLVVGSLDASLHGAASGRRFAFGQTPQGEGKRIYISSMAVRETWQRRGLAKILLAHVDELARQFDVKDLFLHVEWDNLPAVALYTKCGFNSTRTDDPTLIPKWVHFLAKKEHTLMRKRAS